MTSPKSTLSKMLTRKRRRNFELPLVSQSRLAPCPFFFFFTYMWCEAMTWRRFLGDPLFFFQCVIRICCSLTDYTGMLHSVFFPFFFFGYLHSLFVLVCITLIRHSLDG